MKKEQWYEDQPVLRDDLVRAQSTKEEAITERQLDLFDYGVINNSQTNGESSAFLIQQGPSTGLFVTVGTGTAVSPSGERILISAPLSSYNSSLATTQTDNGIGGTTLTPQSTGSQNIPVVNNATNRIWVGYLQVLDPSTFTLAESTNERLFVSGEDGYQFAVTTTSTNPDPTNYVLIGEVVTAGGVVTSINSSNTLDSTSYGPVNIPASSPYQLSLPVEPNIPSDLDRPNSIPVISGYTYVTTTPAAGQFTVNFSSGIVTFNAANASASVTISYSVLHVRCQSLISRAETVGGQLHLNQPTATYNLGSNIYLTDHLNAVGTGVVTATNPHGTSAADIGLSDINDLGEILATSGIVTPTGNASSLTSSLSPTAVFQASPPSANAVTIAPLASGEYVNMNGTIISSTNIPSTSTFYFVNPYPSGSPIAAGAYYFYIDSILKTVQMASSLPASAFPIASIQWNGSYLVLPITDLRIFGTGASRNLQLQTVLGLSTGAATDNRALTLFNARLIGSTAVTFPSNSFTGLGGTTLNLTTDGTAASVTFPSLPVNTTIQNAVSSINTAIPNVTAVATAAGQIKILSPISLVITGGTAASILGFPVSPAAGSSSSGLLQEIRISGSTSSVGTAGVVYPAVISLAYNTSNQLTQSTAYMGNEVLTTTLTYNTDGSVKTITETVS